ncbi:MAG: DUF5317 family protein [Saccharofermentanales bacterium]
MLETILLAVIFAKIKGNKIKPLFQTWTMYPIFVIEIIYLIFQITVFAGNYTFIPYAPVLKKVYLFLFIIPIFVYKEYFAGIAGSAFVMAGTLLNNFVMSQNGGKMPVFPTLSYITGYIRPEAFDSVVSIHALGDANTKWRFLSDIIDVGWSVLSIGDVFIRILAFLVVYQTILTLNSKKNVILK